MKMILIWLLIFPVILVNSASAQQSQPTDPVYEELQKILGVPGKQQPGGVLKFSWPRKDLDVSLNGTKIETGLAFGSWAAFKKMANNDLMTMGDLVLLPAEINPVMSELQSGGFQILAIHNHLTGEVPEVMYVHFMGHGAGVNLANTLKAALAKTKTPTTVSTPKNGAQSDERASKIFDIIQKTIGRESQITGNLLQINVARKDTIRMKDEEIPPSMGMAIAMNFQIAGNQIATTGDFVLTGDEVNPVISELLSHDIRVTALHNHMLEDEPRLFFMHFWSVGSAEKVADGLKAALSKVKVK